MKHLFLTAAITALVSTNAMALDLSAASKASSGATAHQTGTISNGNSFSSQVTWSGAGNTTYAKGTNPTGDRLSLSTGSSGYTYSNSVGRGLGTTSGYADQSGGAIAKGNIAFDNSSAHKHKKDHGGVDVDGYGRAVSKSSQNTVAESAVTGTGRSFQQSDASAWNDTTLKIGSSAKSDHLFNKLTMYGKAVVDGGSSAFARGTVGGGGTGSSDAIARQKGKARFNVAGTLGSHNHNNLDDFTSDGTAAISGKAKFKTTSTAGGTNNHFGDTAVWGGSQAIADALVRIKAGPNSGNIKLDAFTQGDTGHRGFARGDGVSTYKGKGKAHSDVAGVYNNGNGNQEVSQTCVANGGTGNCGNGNGLDGGNGTSPTVP